MIQFILRGIARPLRSLEEIGAKVFSIDREGAGPLVELLKVGTIT